MNFRILRVSLILFIHLIFAARFASAQSVVDTRLLSKTNDWNISSDIEFIADSVGNGIMEIATVPKNKWSSNKNEFSFHKGISTHGYWIRFTITGIVDSFHTYYLQLSNKGINEVELFIQNKNSFTSLGKTGDHYSFKQRPYPAPHFTFPITIRKNESVSCYLYCNKENENLNLKLRLFPGEILEQKEKRALVYLGFFCGVLLMAFIVSLIMLFIFKDRLSFWYAIYILLVVDLLLVYEGLDFQWFYPNLPFYAGISRYVASSLTLAMMIYVMQLLCNQKADNSKFYKITEIFKYTIFLMAPLTWFVYKFYPTPDLKKIHFIFFLFQQIGGVLLIFISSLEKMLQRYKPAAFYFTAIILLLYSSITAILLELGKIDKNADTPNLLQWSFVLEVILISIGILYKYKLVQQKNNLLSTELSDLKLTSVKQLLQTQQEEQLRIAEDLHDLLGAQLAALKFKVAGSKVPEEDKNEITKVLDTLSSSTRLIAHNLRPNELDQHDLSHVIEVYLQRLNKEQAIQFEFIQNGPQKSLHPDQELIVYKIIMELITNILKHSGASEALVQLSFHDQNLELIVEDNGKGIEDKRNEGMGLLNIRKRVAQLKGNLHIDSSPGNTTFIFTFSYNESVP